MPFPQNAAKSGCKQAADGRILEHFERCNNEIPPGSKKSHCSPGVLPTGDLPDESRYVIGA